MLLWAEITAGTAAVQASCIPKFISNDSKPLEASASIDVVLMPEA